MVAVTRPSCSRRGQDYCTQPDALRDAGHEAERDLLPMARALDIAVIPWSVLGAGVLTGKYNAEA